MATIIKQFDILSFVKKSRDLGVSEAVAEHQARHIEQAIDIAVNKAKNSIEEKNLATKGDILEVKKEIKEVELKIEASKNQMVLWIVGLFITSGIIQHLFK